MSIKIEDRARAMSQPIAKIKPRVAHLHGRFLENKRKKRKKRQNNTKKKPQRKKKQICFSVMNDRESSMRTATFTQ